MRPENLGRNNVGEKCHGADQNQNYHRTGGDDFAPRAIAKRFTRVHSYNYG